MKDKENRCQGIVKGPRGDGWEEKDAKSVTMECLKASSHANEEEEELSPKELLPAAAAWFKYGGQRLAVYSTANGDHKPLSNDPIGTIDFSFSPNFSLSPEPLSRNNPKVSNQPRFPHLDGNFDRNPSSTLAPKPKDADISELAFTGGNLIGLPSLPAAPRQNLSSVRKSGGRYVLEETDVLMVKQGEYVLTMQRGQDRQIMGRGSR